jgi:hypothetical protein
VGGLSQRRGAAKGRRENQEWQTALAARNTKRRKKEAAHCCRGDFSFMIFALLVADPIPVQRRSSERRRDGVRVSVGRLIGGARRTSSHPASAFICGILDSTLTWQFICSENQPQESLRRAKTGNVRRTRQGPCAIGNWERTISGLRGSFESPISDFKSQIRNLRFQISDFGFDPFQAFALRES